MKIFQLKVQNVLNLSKIILKTSKERVNELYLWNICSKSDNGKFLENIKSERYKT